MKISFKSKIFLFITVALFGLILFPLSGIKANSGASLYLNPSEGIYKAGDLFSVSVMVNTGDETINATQATLSFSGNLEVQNVSKSGSIFGLWIEDPSYDNLARTISFGGAGAGTAYKGSAGKLISVTLKAKTAGEGKIEFTSSLVKYGANTIEIEAVRGGNYEISALSLQPETEEIQEVSEKPVLMPADTVEETTPVEEIEEATVPEEVATAKEATPQQAFLANLLATWGGIDQLTILLMVVLMGIIFLTYFVVKECRLFQRKKKMRNDE